MKKILCPTDFSEAAHSGIAYAAKFAKVIDAEITLFNVQSRFDISVDDLFKSRSEKLLLINEQLELQSRRFQKHLKFRARQRLRLVPFP
jgi:hypothetical protein